ncbi:hypothetical protein PR048_026845 [Dryococelus australis]|uniref:Uncharacterized protein n=1 Tax=Dryococelus australis TaxID=614101 RepID=A0ABQ9GMG7_9NEOP|nr:hypothetical protein PR048_026845 [Dryococelus australis]
MPLERNASFGKTVSHRVLFSSVLIVCAVVTAVVMFSLGRWTWFELIEPRLNRVNYETVMTNSKEVSIVSMPRGGDSLFMAVAHQLNPHSLDMSKRAEKLRLGVCYQLMQGLDKYRTLVLESLGDHCGRYAERKSQDSQILHFLQDLARPGFPGGKESLQAIADMLQVSRHTPANVCHTLTRHDAITGAPACHSPSPRQRTRFESRRGHSRMFARVNRGGISHWSVGFLEGLPLPPPLHSGAVPYHLVSPSSALKTLIPDPRCLPHSGSEPGPALPSSFWVGTRTRAAFLILGRNPDPRCIPHSGSEPGPALPSSFWVGTRTRAAFLIAGFFGLPKSLQVTSANWARAMSEQLVPSVTGSLSATCHCYLCVIAGGVLPQLPRLMQVDMMVFVEGGDMDRVKSSAGYIHHTISVVRRRAERGGCRGRFHYDSVYSVSRFVVEMATTPQPS